MADKVHEADEADTGPFVTIRAEDGRVAAFRPEAVIGMITAADGETTEVLLAGGASFPIRGRGGMLRKRIAGEG